MFHLRRFTHSTLAAGAAFALLTPAAFAQKGGGGHGGGGHGGGGHGGGGHGGYHGGGGGYHGGAHYSGGYSGGRVYSAPAVNRSYYPGTVNRAPVYSSGYYRPTGGYYPGAGYPGRVTTLPAYPGRVYPGYGAPYYGGYRPYPAYGYGYGYRPYPAYGYGYGYRPYYPSTVFGLGFGPGGLAFGLSGVSGGVAYAIGFGLPWYGGYGYGGYRSATVIPSTYAAVPATYSVVPQSAVQVDQPPVVTAQQAPAGPTDYATQATALFRAGQYLDAVMAYRHAAVDQPQNWTLAVQAAYALIAAGKLDEAAGAAQQGLSQLPPEQWAEALKQAGALFPSQAAFDQAAIAAAKASDKAPADPGTRFATGLMAFGRGEMGRAAADLDAVLKVAPQDTIAKKLREMTGIR